MIKFKRKTIIVIIVAVLVVFGIWQSFFKKEKSEFSLAEVNYGNVIQEVSETGQLKKGEKINLGFQSSGQIEKIYVEVGDNITSGQELAKLDTSQLSIQLSQAKAALSIIESQKGDAELSLDSARQKLEDTIATANETIEKDYKEALSVLDDSYLKAYNALNFVDLLKRTYFERGDVESVNVSEDRDRIERALSEIKFYLDKSKNSQNRGDIDIALSKAGDELSKIKTAIEGIRNIIEAGNYKDIVSSADKNTLDTHKSNINTVHSNVVSSQADISLDKAANTTEINNAQSQVSVLENQLQGGKNSLYQAQINQAEAQIELLEDQIENATLKSPLQGQIADINKREGEMVQPTLQDFVVTILPAASFEITVDIYEGDIVEVKVGNPVDINLVAFPDRTFEGKVIAIDPAENLNEGVVYYKVTIIFEGETPEGIKSGMTADVKIKTLTKENVLTVPQGAIQTKNGDKIVQIYKNKKNMEDRKIVIGIEGSDGTTEVISGLDVGEKVILK